MIDFLLQLTYSEIALYIGLPLISLLLICKLFLTKSGGQTTRGSKYMRDKILVVGPSGSGKTSFLYKLARKQIIPTLSSQEEINAQIKVCLNNQTQTHEQQNQLQVSFLDIPGHGHFNRVVRQNIKYAKGVIFFIDSSKKQVYILRISKDTNFRESINQASMLLYQILNDDYVIDNQIEVMIVCNKQQIPLSQKPMQIQKALQTQIELLKTSKLALLQDDQKQGFLESQHGKFQFKNCQNKVTFTGTSLKHDEQSFNSSGIKQFILRLFEKN